MRSEIATSKIADWAYRNPSGLQPVVTFPEDYASLGHLHYNVPPLRLEAGRSASSTVTTAPTTRTQANVQWRGYTGAKSFFTQQPMPGSTALLLTGEYVPHRSEIDSAITKHLEPPSPMSFSVPCNSAAFAAKSDGDDMLQTNLPTTRPIQISFSNSRIRRFDSHDHSFQQKLC